jgi:DNA-binding MarR family transcriptional regulator
MSDDFEAAKRASFGQVLFKCARLLNERAIARVNEEGGRPLLRQSITNMLPHLAAEGIRLTDLARKVGVTKQATSKLVMELVDEGVLALVPDPEDARAKLVRITPAGMKAMRHGLGVLASLQKDLSRELGEARMSRMHDDLVALLDALEKPARSRRR